ncbi:MAG: type IV pilus twitching motility protein PilT [Bacillota bacterium]|nr:type IV pilus twitching motility protein PilT [Bacillota bacterium]
MEIDELLLKAVELGASDIHISVGIPPTIRKNGRLVKIGDKNVTAEDTEIYSKKMLRDEKLQEFEKKGEIDLSYSLQSVGRFRVNIYRQRGTYCIAIRPVNVRIPTFSELGLPEIVKEFSKKTKGLVLVTGPTGSGKSTTLAAIINQINEERDCHILTLEDPIEYLHKHKQSIVNQREIGYDSNSYANALRAALREDPDVILVGEMRDMETISIAITAAETGHYVLSTLHTLGAANTIDRIIDVFPPYQQQQIKVQLSTILQGIISQQLLTRRDQHGRVAALEILIPNPAIRNLIREGKTHQINSIIQTGGKFGMQTMDNNLVNLLKRNIINYEDALAYAADQENIIRIANL